MQQRMWGVMTTVVRRNNLAAIPPQIADALGIKEGTRLEWTDLHRTKPKSWRET
jgi:bifunctional DNA-binding transcriptional regulator/antitoxin component of YhaV-PrlF toxin-antitoxin module